MQITVTFDSIEEMKDFTEHILVGDNPAALSAGKPIADIAQAPTEQTAPVMATQTVVPVAPAQPVQMTSAAPVPPVTPVQSVQPAAVPTAPVQAVPTSTHTYTPDELAKAAMQLMDSGRQNDLLALLQQFGTSSIPSLQPSQYGAFATALRGLGAQI